MKNSNAGAFNCYDGDPSNLDITTTTDFEDKYFGDGTTATYYGTNSSAPYMCIKNRGLPFIAGMTPNCPTTRRLFEERMEEMFSSYQKHNSKINLSQPQPEESDMKTKEVDGAKDDETDAPPCRMGVPIADVRRFNADRCNPLATPKQAPLEILSRSGKTVTFTLSQVWKQCDDGSSANKMDWIAADFVVPESGDLECFKTFKPDCGNVNAFTAKCTEGRALIDIYAVDETATGLFYQTDGSALTIPDACAAGDKKGDATKACKFRYILSCLETCEDDGGSYTWWPSALVRKLTDAFRLG